MNIPRFTAEDSIPSPKGRFRMATLFENIFTNQIITMAKCGPGEKCVEEGCTQYGCTKCEKLTYTNCTKGWATGFCTDYEKYPDGTLKPIGRDYWCTGWFGRPNYTWCD